MKIPGFFSVKSTNQICLLPSVKNFILVLVTLYLISGVIIGPSSAEGFCVTSEPAGVSYYIDGVYIGETKPNEACTTDYAQALKPHTITFEKEGYETYSYVQKQEEMGYGVYRVFHRMRPVIKSSPTPLGKGNIQFYSPLNGVDVYLNGEKIRNTNTEERFSENDLFEGVYLIEAKRRGYLEWAKEVTVQPGQTTTVTLDLTVKESHITINSIPSSAEIFIDDKSVGITPLQITISAGTHKIKIQAPYAFENFEESYEINDEKKELNYTLIPTAQIIIPESESLIEKNRRFQPEIAESELNKAKVSFSNQDYVLAYDSAKNASKWAKDVDGDGIVNEWDFFPYFANDYLYTVPLILIFLLCTAFLVDRHFCSINANIEMKVLEVPSEKRMFKLHLTINLNREIKSMSCSISLDDRSIGIIDAPGEHIFDLGQLKRGNHEVSAELLILQKRYGKVELLKTLEFDAD